MVRVYILRGLLLFSYLFLFFSAFSQSVMMFSDSSRLGRPFAKDPHVINWKDYYLMYYSIPKGNNDSGWGIGIAKSYNLIDWEKVGEVTPVAEYENKGICAPCALVLGDSIHLFYQTYGNGVDDAICHAISKDGINFIRNSTNPIFRPTGNWNCGRAIDAEVIRCSDSFLLYFATRDPSYKKQIIGVAQSYDSSFIKSSWKVLKDDAILYPTLKWEGECVEGASLIKRNGKYYMFYAGSYNNTPQQIGVAVSENGIEWKRIKTSPFLTNGEKNEWNSSESGHPHIFDDKKTGRSYLFYQGNNDNGMTWYISNIEIFWNENGPYK